MGSYRVNNLAVTIEKSGADGFTKASYPIRVGKYSEIRSPRYEFHFNLGGEIRFIRGLGADWRHPGELLKRTDGNDWAYYSLGSVGERIFSWLGEYYLPCPAYPTNTIWEFQPFNEPVIMMGLAAWAQLFADISTAEARGLPEEVRGFFALVASKDESALHRRAKELHDIIGGRLSVLPPDTRHVDYEVIPLVIADGCRYHCDFCCLKTPRPLTPRPWGQIEEQIRRLGEFYGRNLANYRAVFLADHDGLGAGDELIAAAATRALEAWDLHDPVFYLFGSADSLLKAGDGLLRALNDLPAKTVINLGLESADRPTLSAIGKPLSEAKVRAAFSKMLAVNREYPNLEVTANFLLGDMLPPAHQESLAELLAGVAPPDGRKGAVYLSPMMQARDRRALLDSFFQIKKASRLPAFVYLIQRL